MNLELLQDLKDAQHDRFHMVVLRSRRLWGAQRTSSRRRSPECFTELLFPCHTELHNSEEQNKDDQGGDGGHKELLLDGNHLNVVHTPLSH